MGVLRIVQLRVFALWRRCAGNDDAALGIRYELGNWSENNAIKLYPEWLVPACTTTHLGTHQIGQACDLGGSSITMARST
ncbi:hypothetical protein [Variovorax sp. YR566]|uniref:hypothetical protein n=1 Tax=Variovorax sp. YR566 TaxID=3450237 RepID=UPI003F7F6064